MSNEQVSTTEIPTDVTVKPALTQGDINKAVSNEGYGTVTLGGKEFDIKHFSYDDYLEFVELVPPVMSAFAKGLEINADPVHGAALQFNPMAIDHKALIKVAKNELVRMAWLCLKQSQPGISQRDVKALARHPMELLDVVMRFVEHNEMVKVFADFFQRTLSTLAKMAPELNQVMGQGTAPSA